MEWIKVETRRPKFGEYVLVYNSIYGRYLSAYQEIAESGWGDWTDVDGRRGGLPPSHWMPLPEPPQEDE